LATSSFATDSNADQDPEVEQLWLQRREGTAQGTITSVIALAGRGSWREGSWNKGRTHRASEGSTGGTALAEGLLAAASIASGKSTRHGCVGGKTFGGWPEIGTLGSHTAGKRNGTRRMRRKKPGAIQSTFKTSERAGSGNAVNPMIGCRMQQACGARAEKAVEAGRNGKDGTNLEVAAPGQR